MSTEILKLKAYLMYLQSDDWATIVEEIGVAESTLRNWSGNENWPAKRSEFFGQIQNEVDEQLSIVASEISKHSIEFADEIIFNLKERFIAEVADVPVGSMKELMSGIKDAVEAVKGLLTFSPEQKVEEISPVSGMTFEQKKRMLETINTITLQLPETEQTEMEQ